MTQLGEVTPCCSPLVVMCEIDRRRQYLACKAKALTVLLTLSGNLEEGRGLHKCKQRPQLYRKVSALIHAPTVFVLVAGHHFMLHF
jgi:hypothetical protein